MGKTSNKILFLKPAMWFWYPSPDKSELANHIIVHRGVAKNAKAKNIFLSADPIESEADMKGRKEKI